MHLAGHLSAIGYIPIYWRHWVRSRLGRHVTPTANKDRSRSERSKLYLHFMCSAFFAFVLEKLQMSGGKLIARFCLLYLHRCICTDKGPKGGVAA